ncbi:MAG: alpha/beta hydrolase [Magnetococcales bacterium]|nr:alpha/beta hydrolase [Magnetococcales bacterium]
MSVKPLSIRIIFLLIVVLASCSHPGKKILDVEVDDGYVSRMIVLAETDQQATQVSFVYLHDRYSRPDLGDDKALLRELNEWGYRVVAPTMPWARDAWHIPYHSNRQLLDQAVAEAAQDGKKVILIGRAFGGSHILGYGSDDLPESVTGIISITPNHFVRASEEIQAITQLSVAEARKRLHNGQGDEPTVLSQFHRDERFYQRMTPRVYLSYYDPSKAPDLLEGITNIRKPLLLVAFEENRLMRVLHLEPRFESLMVHAPQNIQKNSRYLKIYDPSQAKAPKMADMVMQWVVALNQKDQPQTQTISQEN